jgi:GNAT superfamily N-acetyltransferase
LRDPRRTGIIAPMGADTAFGWRAITAADAPEWARLLGAIEESYGTEEFVSADDLVADLEDPDVDPERGTIAAFSQRSMVGWAGLRTSAVAGERHDIELLGGVHPAERGRGLGTRLLAWAEPAARALHEARHPRLPLALEASYPAGQDDAVALFAHAGYRPARWFHFMRRELAAAVPARQLPADLRISAYADELSEVARQLRNETFRDHWGSVRRLPAGNRAPRVLRRRGRRDRGGPRPRDRLGADSPFAGGCARRRLRHRHPERGRRIAVRGGGPLRAPRLRHRAHLGRRRQGAGELTSR